MELAVLAQGDQAGDAGLQAVLLAVENSVSHAVAALVGIQRRFCGQEAWVPGGLARFLDIVEPPAHAAGDAVISVAQQALELGVPVEAVAAHGVGDKAEELLAAQVIDPGKGRRRCVMTYSFAASSKWPNFMVSPHFCSLRGQLYLGWQFWSAAEIKRFLSLAIIIVLVQAEIKSKFAATALIFDVTQIPLLIFMEDSQK